MFALCTPDLAELGWQRYIIFLETGFLHCSDYPKQPLIISFVLEWNANSDANCICSLSSLGPAQVSSARNAVPSKHPDAALSDRLVRRKAES